MAALASGSALVLPRLAWPFAQGPTRIRKFVVPLHGLGPTGIPVATPNTNLFPGEDFYHIHVGEFALPHSEWVAGAFLQPAVVLRTKQQLGRSKPATTGTTLHPDRQ